MDEQSVPRPRRRVMRAVLRRLAALGLNFFADIHISGQENLPKNGPLLVVGNHFSFLDPVAMIHAMPWPLDFVGGLRMVNAPPVVRWIPGLWGVLPVRRGSLSRDTLVASRKILNANGVLGIFPEAGSWAAVLRPARPGAAYLASSTHAQILPVGFDGLVDLFPCFRSGKRAQVHIRIGPPFGPLYVSDRGEKDRAKLEEIGHTIMRHIAGQLPQERRGFYSDDPAIREAAKGTEIYPWADVQEK